MFDVFFRLDAARGLERFSRLEIGFSIQVLCLNIAETVGIRSGEYDDVGGDLIIIPQQNKVANFEFLPQCALPKCSTLRTSAPVYYSHGGTALLGRRKRRHATSTQPLALLAHEDGI
jgi:hypothetical protein